MDTEIDPLEGSSYSLDVSVKTEIKEETDDGYNTMALLELAQCVHNDQEPLELNTTDVMMDPSTGLMVCLLCLDDIESNLLMDHMVNAHSYRRVEFKCHICMTVFPERETLQTHRLHCQPQQKKRKRKSIQQLLREVDAMEPVEDIVTCPICMLVVPYFNLKEHLVSEHSNPQAEATCGVCKKSFKSKMTLQQHVKLVHDSIEDSAECEICGQKFRSLKYLSNHKRNVHPVGNKIHKCHVCGKQFKSRLCVHHHTKLVHPPATASARCPHCSKVFKSKVHLQQHLRVSHGITKKS